ncbi:unnamed protein product [Urochloa decumbens]|uniref:DUF4378 domain-containing protein n=1 Tax=Urochloa decumbens TaxID=240449 RepID=A0ABC8W8K1_9POAL
MLWPRCRQVDVVLAGPQPPTGTALPCGPPPPQCPTVQNLNSSGEKKGLQVQSLEEERGAEAEAEAEAMLRGGGSRTSAKPRRPHSQSRPRPPSPPAPSRRASGVSAAAGPESKEPSVLEAPVVSSMEETSFTFEFKRGFKRAKKAMLQSTDAPRGEDNIREGFSNKSNVVPVKKEAPKQVEFTHCSPGIVARLMGLDTVPRPKKVLDRCQSDIHANLQRHLSGVVQQAACASSGDQPCNVSSDELPALKDVFEVSEMENMAMHELLQPQSEEQHLRNLEADLEFVRQKFLDAKRLATDEGHRNSKEFSEALDILHSKKDAFLEILEENRNAVSGFSGHILSYSGLQCSPQSSNTTAAESSDQEILCSMAGVCDEMFDRPREFEKLIPSMLLKENSVAAVEPLTPNGGKSKGSSHRSQIVVLKPNLQRKGFTPVVSSQEASKYKERGGTQHSKPLHHSKQYSVPQKNEVPEEEGIATQKVRKQTTKSVNRRRQSKEEYNLAVDTEKTKLASTSHDDTMPIYSSMNSAGPSVSRKARKHLSERWQIACQSGSEKSIPKGITTLGEMLGLSDGDAPKETSHKGSSDPNLSRSNVREVSASPLGISSKDGWKKEIYCEDDSRGSMSRNFPRSKSLPASATTSTKLSGRRQSAPTCRLPILKDILNTPADESENAPVRKRSPIRNAKQRNGRTIVHLGKENMLPEKEIHVTLEKARHSICISDLSQASNMYTEKYPDDAIRTEGQQKSDSAVQHDKKNSEGHMGWTYQTSFPETKEVLSIQNQDNIALEEERSPSVEIDIAQVDTRATQSVSTASEESCECSSPTASSPRSSGEGTSYFGIFKSINVGIQELRAQLKILKMEGQEDICGDYSDMLATEECDNMNISTYQETTEEQLPIFKNEEDRDLCYVQDMLASVCDLPDYPEGWQVGSDVFLCLENKYSKLLLWSKSDRKLLFDLVNSILADMTTPDNNLHSKIMMKCWPEIDRHKLAENVWQMVQKQSNYEDFALEDAQPLPLDHRSELEVIGMKIARMIHDDIIKDTIVRFLLQENYLVSN